MKRIIVLGIIALNLVLLVACSQTAKMGGMVNAEASETRENEEHKVLIEGEGFPYTVTDYLNRKTVIEENDVRWAVASGTYINTWYTLGGESICTTDLGSAHIDDQNRDAIAALPSIGAVYNPNTELLMEYDPQVTIAQVGTQTTMGKTLETMEKKCLLLHMRSYQDVLDHIAVFGKLLNNKGQAQEIINKMEAGKKAITDQLPSENKSVVILYVTSSSLSVKLEKSIAGDVANILQLNNIAADLPPDTIGSETTPLDIEYIADKNPDMILVTSMISSNEEAKLVMNEQFQTNPVWETVEAVKEGNVAYLPQQYFLYNAAHNYVGAIDYMAHAVYPEIYGALDE